MVMRKIWSCGLIDGYSKMGKGKRAEEQSGGQRGRTRIKREIEIEETWCSDLYHRKKGGRKEILGELEGAERELSGGK